MKVFAEADMLLRKKVTMFFVIGILLLTACAPKKISEEDRSRIFVVSLQENWQKLEAKALDWRSDAYLVEIIIPIDVDAPPPGEFLIQAYYNSASDNKEFLAVMLDQNGELRSGVSALPQPTNEQPIARSDWQIDSVEALKSLLTEEDIRFLLLNPVHNCSTLDLKRNPRVGMDIVVWRILISDCVGSDYRHDENMNAISGEKIK